MASLAVAGTAGHFHPVPFWDTWDVGIAVYLDLEAGALGELWALHNEHRLVLAKSLVWLDHRGFGGRQVLLLCANYALIAGAALLLWAAMRRHPKDQARGNAVGGLLALAWLVQWMQWENLTWGLQVQFFLAYVVTLAALLCLARASEVDGARWFALACVLGLAAAGTMANGVLTLPLMAVLALLLRMPTARVGFILILAAAVWFAYFRGYHTPPHHQSPWQGWANHPVDAFRYFLAYLGSPAHFLFGGGASRASAQLAGAAFLAAGAYVGGKVLVRAREQPTGTALLVFVAFACASAGATAGARLMFGIETATASRYTTAALMAWAALAVAWYLGRRDGMRPGVPLAIAAALLAAWMLRQQLTALDPVDQRFARREVAALALAMKVRDEATLAELYPRIEPLLKTAAKAAAKGVSIFGRSPYREAREPLGVLGAIPASRDCAGAIDATVPVPGTAFRRVSGRILQGPAAVEPTLLRFMSGEGRVEGYAISGGAQPSSTFEGYVRDVHRDLAIVRQEPPCVLRVRLPER